MKWMRPSLNGPPLVRVTAAALFFVPIALTAQSGGSPASHTIIIKQMHFEPAQVNIKAGESIEWKNQDIFAHTVSADDQSFDSGLIDPGGSWKTTINKPGTIGYHCRPHPNMKASLVIAARGTADTSQQGEQTGSTQSAKGQSLAWRPPLSPEEFHPILVNFTAALLPLALLSDNLGRIFRQQSLHNAAWWMVLYEAALTPLTAAAGWWWKHASGPMLPPRLIMVHEWLGTAAALLFIALAIWRWRIHKSGAPPSTAYLAFAGIAVLALVYQGSLGGAMAFGQ